MLAATAVLSQFFRSSNSVIGPELIRDLSLSSEALGFANGCFFAALLLVQIPVGIAFDRIGRASPWASCPIDDGGALLHASAQSAPACACPLRGRPRLRRQLHGRRRADIALVSATVVGHRAELAVRAEPVRPAAAGLPLAVAAETVGWRVTFVFMGAIAALVGVLFPADRA
jgi:hypothetical protein